MRKGTAIALTLLMSLVIVPDLVQSELRFVRLAR
jgi:hypothetical protein